MRISGVFGRVVTAAVLAAAMGVSVAAQSYNAIGSGGPLWWFPANDGSYSRHHDVWHMSYFEALNDDWTVATSFPTIPGEVVWVSNVSGAPENSACDVQNGTELVNVGPPYPEDGNPIPRTARTPSGVGGFAGLQISMHIGEWWQGMKYRGYYDNAAARAEHFSGSTAAYDPDVFGWFDVRMKDGAGTVQRPPLYDGGHSVMWINPLYSHWQLWGGGGFTMPCLGISMVQMHGVNRGGARRSGRRRRSGPTVGSAGRTRGRWCCGRTRRRVASRIWRSATRIRTVSGRGSTRRRRCLLRRGSVGVTCRSSPRTTRRRT